MKIRPKVVTPPPRKVIVAVVDDDEDNYVPVKPAKPPAIPVKRTVLEEEDEETSDGVSLSPARHTAIVVAVRDLDPDKTYGIMFYAKDADYKPGQNWHRSRRILPATGREIQCHGRSVFESRVVNFSASSAVPKGFRLVEFPDHMMLIAICAWTGPKYTPPDVTAPRQSRPIKIGRSYENRKPVGKKPSRVAVIIGKVRPRLGQSRR